MTKDERITKLESEVREMRKDLGVLSDRVNKLLAQRTKVGTKKLRTPLRSGVDGRT